MEQELGRSVDGREPVSTAYQGGHVDGNGTAPGTELKKIDLSQKNS